MKAQWIKKNIKDHKLDAMDRLYTSLLKAKSEASEYSIEELQAAINEVEREIERIKGEE